jgi:hypothetical protein
VGGNNDISKLNWEYRSSCFNDKCLFITNIDPLPLRQGLLFDSTVTSNMSQYEQLSNQYRLQLKSNYIHESFHKAVDQDKETCWNTIVCKFLHLFMSFKLIDI